MKGDLDPLRTEAPILARSGWRLALRGVELRLRFVVALAVLAGLMTGWPWLRAGWDRLASRWQARSTAAAVARDTEFFCPMDPGVISAWPAICPICNMDLIPRKKADAVLLPEGVVARMQISPYRIQLAGIRTVPVQPQPNSANTDSAGPLTVPLSAVVHHGETAIVYVETMPGMFDGVPVQLGPRDEDCYSVVSGLKAGQRVVAAGAFLIDAESRLNPNLATQYFGANAQSTASRMPKLPRKSSHSKGAAPELTAEDRLLADRQRICPVTDASLGSMGTPVAVQVNGRKVFLCCRGCEAALRNDPDKYLQKLAANPAGDAK